MGGRPEGPARTGWRALRLTAVLVGAAAGAGGCGDRPDPAAEESPAPAAAPIRSDSPAARERALAVHLLRGEDVVRVSRRVAVAGGDPPPDTLLDAALRSLLEGPTAGERAEGLRSPLEGAGPALLDSVTVEGGRATVFFGDLASTSPNAAASAASAALLESLERTVFDVPGVDAVEYRMEGSCDRFWNWLQRDCRTVERPGAS